MFKKLLTLWPKFIVGVVLGTASVFISNAQFFEAWSVQSWTVGLTTFALFFIGLGIYFTQRK